MTEKLETPYKYGKPVLTGSGTPGAFDELCVDGPFVFFHLGRYFMSYVGFDGKGYQTAIAESADLLHWRFRGVILPRNDLGQWDSIGVGGVTLLRDTYELYAKPTLKKVNGKYWLAYNSYPAMGYESGSAEIGLAWTEDEELMDWHRLPEPVLSWRDGQPWDRGGLYKACLMENEGTYYLFYNAKDKDERGWIEQTGIATSKDMVHWERYPENPVLPVTPGAWDSRFAANPMIFRADGRWVMFYYGYDRRHAQDGVAFSDDLLHWTKHPEPILRVGAPGELDATHAHKPSVVCKDGVLYHFYCAVRPWRAGDPARNFFNEFRCITVAMSSPVGKYLTPYKLGKPVLTGSNAPGAFDELCVDCPFVFLHNGLFHMMHVGFDGKGYQTGLAVSSDLIHWAHKGVILPRDGLGRWDSVGSAGTTMLRQSNDLYAPPLLKKADGKYWLMYHSYPKPGYESGPAELGLAWSDDEELLVWHKLDNPVFSWRDGQAWDHGGLYKVTLMEHDGLYRIFYNAKNQDERGWTEQSGTATSPDMLHWTRCERNPVLPVTPGAWDERFCSDPVVFRADGRWVMFYFGLGAGHAQDGIAFSDDLLHWVKHPEPIIRHGEPGELDEKHAHKPSIVYHNGVLYHFYCAVRPWREGDPARGLYNEFRTITVAASRPFEA
jgi:predicted GH43/DUF377 family glycosyl hydrolase